MANILLIDSYHSKQNILFLLNINKKYIKPLLKLVETLCIITFINIILISMYYIPFKASSKLSTY
jgi:hypothetical protein